MRPRSHQARDRAIVAGLLSWEWQIYELGLAREGKAQPGYQFQGSLPHGG